MIKKQSTIKKRLDKEVSLLCYQIGIPSTEEPKVCWNTEVYKWNTELKPNQKRLLGQANFRNNTILVDLKRHKEHNLKLIDVRDTLIHELVHIRFQKMKHGFQFKQTIEYIKKGQRYPIRTTTDMRFP